MNKKKIISLFLTVIVVLGLIIWCVYDIKSQTVADEIGKNKAEEIVNTQLDAIAVTAPLKYIASNNSIKVNSVSYGNKKDVILDCTVDTLNVYKSIKPLYNDFLDAEVKKKNSTMFKSSLDFKMEFESEILSVLNECEKTTENIKITLYDTEKGFMVHTDDKTVNSVYGGVTDIKKDVNDIKTITVKTAQGTREEKIQSTNVNKGFIECFSVRATDVKPETAHGVAKIWNSLKKDFYVNFIKYDRWKTIFKGLWVTIKLTICALLIGIVLGFVVAFVRCTRLKNSNCGFVLRFFDSICQIYLTVIRGTPAVVQIMIIYFVIFMPMGADKFFSAVVCFGLNSGAYVAEIVRGGIMNVDDGQIEAGRSLGFNYMQTMYHIVFPQAFKAVLPALANEFVVLLKETSVAFYIGLGDLMYAGNAIRSATYSPFMPLLAVAVIYLIMVLGLSRLVGMLERRLRSNER